MAISYTSTVGGFDYGFDFEEKYIYVDSALDTIQIEDLYDAIKEAQASEVGVVYDKVASGSGLDELDTGVSTFLTIRIFSTWEIRSQKSSGKVITRGGNIVKDNGDDPFYDDGTVFYIAFFSQAGIKTTTAVGSAVTETDKDDIRDRIMDEVIDATLTFKEALRVMLAEAAGQVSISGNSISFRDEADTKNRIVATTDSNGQRTSVTLDGS